MSSSTESTQVQLAVYDLSRGMAKAMSRQILGQQIDGIWHTGIVVFGYEYYFGGGVQKMRWGQFAQSNQLPPDQVLNMGVTTRSQSEFENYLRSIQHLYTNATYDLINNNCNNFADVICQYLTGHGIPNQIVDLPRIVFSTPGGAMLRPMIEGIQNNIRQQHGYGLDPFSAATSAPPPAQSFENSLSAAVTAVAQNALLNSAVNRSGVDALTLADLEEHPLISADASTVNAVAAKILNLPDKDGVKGNGLTEEEKTLLRAILTNLSDTSSNTTSPSSVAFTLDDYLFMEKLLSQHPETHMSCLFIVRLMFLHDKLSDYGRLTLVREIIQRLLSPLNAPSSSSSSTANPFASIPAHVMALCSLANLLSHDTGKSYLLGAHSSLPQGGAGERENDAQQHFINELIDVALHGLTHSRAEVRQMSIALAYNLTLALVRGAWAREDHQHTSELDPNALQLLCGCFEGLMDEKDGLVRRRRLAVICRIVRAFKSSAVMLVKDLGFEEILQSMKIEAVSLTPPLTKDEVKIIEELLFYLK